MADLSMFVHGAVIRELDGGALPADRITFIRVELDGEGRPVRGHTTGDKGGWWQLDAKTLQWTGMKDDLE